MTKIGRTSASEQLGLVVAERVLKCGGNNAKQLTIRIGLPRRVDDLEWSCPFQIEGLARSKVDFAYGIDAVQALSIAFEAVRSRLERSRTRYTWLGGEDGDHGLARTIPTFFGRNFSAEISRMVDREIERFAKGGAEKSQKGSMGE